MKNFTIKLLAAICVLMEVVLIYKISTSTNIVFQELFSGLALFIMLIMIRLTCNLTTITYKSHEGN